MEPEEYRCPVCYDPRDKPIEDYEICSQCGAQYGYDATPETYDRLRELYIAEGSKRWARSFEATDFT